jgi:hypothetical protein
MVTHTYQKGFLLVMEGRPLALSGAHFPAVAPAACTVVEVVAVACTAAVVVACTAAEEVAVVVACTAAEASVDPFLASPAAGREVARAFLPSPSFHLLASDLRQEKGKGS